MSAKNLFPLQVYRQHGPQEIMTTAIYNSRVTVGQPIQASGNHVAVDVYLNGIGYDRILVQNAPIRQNSTRVSRHSCH
jgi:hypothetical protein